MCDRHDDSDPDKERYECMDELLCEYVDGTMDPAVRRVFEEYIRANPELAAHIDDLKRTRALLCHYRCRMNAPFGFSRRVHREVTEEMMRAQAPLFSSTSQRLRQATSLTSMVVAMMMVGLVSGSLLVEGESPAGEPFIPVLDATSPDLPDRSLDALRAHPVVQQSGFGAFSLTWAPAVVEVTVAADTQIVRSVEFDHLRQAAALNP